MIEGTWNPARVFEALGKIGYKPDSAILDIADNSVSANCSHLDIVIEPMSIIDENGGKKRIIKHIFIIDNGSGMDKKDIHNALSLGSSEESYQDGTLSKFGMGLKSASSSLGKSVEIISKKHDEEWLFASLDQDILLRENKYLYELKEINSKEASTHFPKHARKISEGTIIKISKIRTESMQSITDIINSLTSKTGIIYHFYLEGKIPNREKLEIYINGEKIIPCDPLFIDTIDKSENNGNLDETSWNGTSVKWITKEKSIDLSPTGDQKAKVAMTQLPHPPSFAYAKATSQKECRDQYRIGAGNYGFYIYRNGRLISWADSLGMINQHQDLYSFRGRLLLDNNSDDILNIDVTKSRIVLSEIADQQLRPLVQEAKKKSISAWNFAKNELDKLTNNEDPHNTLAPILDEIGSELEQGDKIDEDYAGSEEKKELSRRRKEATKNKKTTSEESKALKTEGKRVQYVSSLSDNQLWERAHDADIGLIVKVNQSHRFYKEIIEPNRENPILIKAFDLLFFSLARGEWSLVYKSAFDEKAIEPIVDEYREIVGSELSEIIRKIDKKSS